MFVAQLWPCTLTIRCLFCLQCYSCDQLWFVLCLWVPPGRSLTFGKLYTVFLKLFTAPRYHHASSRKSLHGRSTANESSYAWEGRGYTATAAHAAATVSKCQAAPKTLRTQLQRLCARSSKDSAAAAAHAAPKTLRRGQTHAEGGGRAWRGAGAAHLALERVEEDA